MEKQEAVVDTCFLKKLASDGEHPESIKRVLDEMGYIPVVNKYVAEQELSLNRYLDELVKTGYIRTIEYEEYILDDYDKTIYEDHFEKLYNEMREYLKIKGGPKQMPELNIPRGESIFTAHFSGSSMGDVHMVLMASYLRLPIILTQDSDIQFLRDMAKRRLSMSSYQLQILDVLDLIQKIAEKENSAFSRKELKQLVKQVGEKERWSEIVAVLEKKD